MLIIIGLILLFISGCDRRENNKVAVDFKEKDSTVIQIIPDTTNTLKVAISAMISPKQTFLYYQELLDYLSKRANCKINLEMRKTYNEVNNLLESGNLDFAFICSGAYIELASKCPIDILAVPQTNGTTTYQAYIIANINSRISKFEDFRGKSFAYTDLLSNTGRLYALKRLKEIGQNDEEFFSKIIYSNAHDYSIQLVNNGLIDGATIDGLIFDFIKTHNPEQIANIKVVEKSENYAIPPIVSRRDKKGKLEGIRNTLLKMSSDSIGKMILSKLQIDRFVPGYDSSYNSIRQIYRIIKK